LTLVRLWRIRQSTFDICHAGVSLSIRLAALLAAGKLFRPAAGLKPDTRNLTPERSLSLHLDLLGHRQFQPDKLGVDHLRELFERLGSPQVAPVDEEGRRARRLYGEGLRRVGFDDFRLAEINDGFVEQLHVQPDLPGILFQILELEFASVDEQLVVIFPKFSLLLRRHRGHVGQGRVLVNFEGIVLPDSAYLVPVDFLDSFEGRTDLRAIRSLKVGELDDGHRGCSVPWKVTRRS
jgi:hypothetical protein